jgi:hypothetical protein
VDDLKIFANVFDAEGREETKMRAFTRSYTIAGRLQPDAGVMHATCERLAAKLRQMVQIGSIVLLRPIGVLSWSMTSSCNYEPQPMCPERTVPKWRATADEDGQYSFAVAL